MSGVQAKGVGAAMRDSGPSREEILAWLRQEDTADLEDLWRRADAVRKRVVGDAVHLRGLIEISNHCVRQCGYCGLRGGHTGLDRYRMSEDEILACARQAWEDEYTEPVGNRNIHREGP
jgi:biotin synthase